MDFLKTHYSLITRVLSALILAPLAIFCIFYGSFIFMAMVMAAALVTAHEWYNMVKGFQNAVAMMLWGMIYISTSYFSFIFLRFGFEEGAWITLTVMLCVWASDIFAYVCGKAFKGPKMAPTISPNKTWSGLAGAVIGFTAVLILFMLYAPLGLHAAPFYGLILAGLVLGVSAQAGDLMISRLKRKAGLKDTGNLIPGHGGLLDRIDALMLIAPLSLLLLLLLQG